MDYIDRIKQLKAEQKITNDELSEKTGIPLGTLSKILPVSAIRRSSQTLSLFATHSGALSTML